jgi:predicted nuclease of predicted toxin-antitoxin system
MKLLFDQNLSFRLVATLVLGHPPKVIWVRLGNCATAAVVALLRAKCTEIHEFVADPAASFLALS